ncbi:MAG: hypothetical protein QGG94_01810 [Prochlorococcaceae cyanobacterium ETNP1_MAG_9]|nr:hypothetical protein [Prochlorococcaceae cyanobacterium ETNP1_MAG_9]
MPRLANKYRRMRDRSEWRMEYRLPLICCDYSLELARRLLIVFKSLANVSIDVIRRFIA